MRKTLIAAAVIAAGAFAYYQLSGTDSKTTIPELDYVPADTVLFSGQFKPVNVADYLKSMGFGPQYYANPEFDQALQELVDSADNAPQVKFLVALLRDYLAMLTPGQDFSAKSGFKNEMRNLMYMVGMSPVLRIEISDADAFFAMFDRAEQDSGFGHQPISDADVSYRRYRFEHEAIKVDLLVTVKDGWATLAVTSESLASANISQLLALAKPAKSFNSEQVLPKLAEKYQLSQDAIGFVSFTELAKSLTSTEGNRLAQDIHSVFAAELDAIADWRSVECQQDVAAITQNWPGIFFDGQLDYSSNSNTQISTNMLLASANNTVLGALSSLRGYLPPHMQSNASATLFHLGLGLDPVQLSSAVGKVWTEMTEPAYSCQPLADIQQQLKQSNPVAMLAMAGMANGVQGMSMTINSLTLDSSTMQPTAVDALVSVSVANARSFIGGLAALSPALADVELPQSGEEADLTQLIPQAAMLGVAAKVKLADDHVLVYSGTTAKQQADAVAASKLEKNGLFSMGLDYAAFFNTLAQAMESSGQPVPDNFKALQEMDMKLMMSVDITEQGIQTKTRMEVGSAAQ